MKIEKYGPSAVHQIIARYISFCSAVVILSIQNFKAEFLTEHISVSHTIHVSQTTG